MPDPSDETTARLAALAAARPEDRPGLLIEFLGADPEGKLRLAATGGVPAPLDGLDLGPVGLRTLRDGRSPDAMWWDETGRVLRLRGADLTGARLRRADLRGVDLTGSNLHSVVLGGANLRKTLLEDSDLREADLAGASLIRAAMGRADLRGALLEDTDLRGASLRFADLRDAIGDQADFRQADLWSANLEEGAFVGADFRSAILREANLRGADLSGVDFRRADLGKADLRGAILQGADLRGAKIGGANFDDARLADARLERVDFSRSSIAYVHLHGAYLDRTRLRRDQLGERIGEELLGQFDQAGQSYQALERNFSQLGEPDASSWAYRRRRRVQKKAARLFAAEALRAGRWRQGLESGARYLSDQAVEWLCDYGESVSRVLMTMFVIYLLFAVLYGATGSVQKVVKTPTGTVNVATSHPLDLAIFSLLAMTTSGSPAVGLVPANETVHLLTGVQASLGIGLTGLLGFVLGNRVRR